MHCLSCTGTLVQGDMDEGIRALICGDCGGRWIPSYQYVKWLQSKGKPLPHIPVEPDEVIQVKDTNGAKQCPECGRLLRRDRVGKGLEFFIEHCGYCGGFWFDANEWETLRDHNLHDNVHEVFSKAWQVAVRQEESHEAEMKRLRDELGAETLDELLRIRKWVDGRPDSQRLRTALIALLGDPDYAE